MTDLDSKLLFGDDRLPERFWSKAVARASGCWEWLSPGPRGYARFQWMGRQRQAHRVSYEALIGPIPEGLQLDHLCRNPPCVNPQHLEPVTSQVNTLRGETIPAANLAKTKCLRGHDFDFLGSKGERMCSQCKAHHAANRTDVNEWRRRKAANGWCTACGGREPRPGLKTCEQCAERFRGMNAAKRARRAALRTRGGSTEVK